MTTLGGERLPEWVFIGYLILSFLSLVSAVFGAQWRGHGKDKSWFDALTIAALSVVGALLLMIPLFYLVYAGMIPTGKPGITFTVMNLLLPLGWAHLAVFAWATGLDVFGEIRHWSCVLPNSPSPLHWGLGWSYGEIPLLDCPGCLGAVVGRPDLMGEIQAVFP